jgi:hypothetical protein
LLLLNGFIVAILDLLLNAFEVIASVRVRPSWPSYRRRPDSRALDEYSTRF